MLKEPTIKECNHNLNWEFNFDYDNNYCIKVSCNETLCKYSNSILINDLKDNQEFNDLILKIIYQKIKENK